MFRKTCSNCMYEEADVDSQPCIACDGFSCFVEKKTIDVKAGQRINFDSQGVKFDHDKPQWSLMQWKALNEVVKVLTYGAKKYAPDNWKKVPNARIRYIDAAFRHMSAYAAGEKNDSETGLNHLAHAMCCLLFLLAFDLGVDKDGIN